ncbi:hypothetical protein LXL04_012516 [Taraxacum kok-saghyz]
MEDDREERLSFSDLQLSSEDQADGKQSSFSTSSSSPNHDFLGFFSANWSDSVPSISSGAHEDIIFCGKVIHSSSKTNQTSDPKKKTDSEINTYFKTNKSSIIRRNSDSFSSFSNGDSSLSTSRSSSLPISWRKKEESKKSDVLAQRTSKLACPSKSRWQVFMFGSGRFPTQMEMSDIRSRQLRRSNSGEEEKTGGKRLSGLIRVLGCGGGFSDETMKGSVYASSC